MARVAPPGVVIFSDGEIVEFRGNTAPYLEIAPGLATLELLHMAREELREPLREALAQARASGAPARREAIRGTGKKRQRVAQIEVVPFQVPGRLPFFLVVFADALDETTRRSDARAIRDPAHSEPGAHSDPAAPDLLAQHALQAVVEELETTNEELRVANEEARSRGDQLHAANEQMKLALEELKTVNEELITVNEETSVQREEASRARDDLSNVLDSVDIPILLVGPDVRVRRFAGAAARVLGLLKGDIGRPLSDLSSPLAAAAAAQTPEVLADLRPRQRTLQDAAGHWYQLNVRPT